jgi:hypothetical protein
MQRAPDRSHSKYRHVYPTIRVDKPFNETNPTNTLSVVKVLTSQAVAETEVSRLNAINANKGCVYFYDASRLVEGGDCVRSWIAAGTPVA